MKSSKINSQEHVAQKNADQILELRGVELRVFLCGTEEFLGLKRCGPEVELMC